jgi:RimJ/RimL family protein N-acetyltransferase
MADLPLPLTTARLTLRPYEAGDLGAIHDMFSREDVCRYLPWPPMDVEQARAKVEQRVRQASVGPEAGAAVLAVIEVATGHYVGEVMLALRSPQDLQGMIGWSIHPAFQGHGFATEAARELLRVGFDELRLHRIAAECDPRNGASIRVMEKLGMRREADLVESEYLKGEWVGSTTFAMLESEWRASAG